MTDMKDAESLAREIAEELTSKFRITMEFPCYGGSHFVGVRAEDLTPIITTHTATTTALLSECRRVLTAASNVGEIRFRTCILSAQVAEQIETLLQRLPRGE